MDSRESSKPSGLPDKPIGEPPPFRFVSILSLALLLRALAAAFMFRASPEIWFYDQASELTCLAHSINSGQGLSSLFGGSTGPSAFLAPGYPLLVAAVYRLFGAHSVRTAAVLISLNVVFSVLTVLALMLLANRIFGNRIAYIAGILCAISPTMIWLPALFWETALSTLLLTSGIVLVLRCVDRPTTSSWIAFGGYCAFAFYVNPALLVTFIGIGAWAAYSNKHASHWRPLLATATCAVLFAVWPIRNAIALRAFVPLRSNLGYELWQGNRPGSLGFFTQDLYLNANREEYNRYAAMGELPYMHEKSSIAVATIKADPLRFMRLSAKRAAIFWTALGGHGVSWVVIGEITLTSMLGISGVLMLLGQRKTGGSLLMIPLLLFPLPYYVTHPDFRFRLLLQPIALLLTAYLIHESLKRLRPAQR